MIKRLFVFVLLLAATVALPAAAQTPLPIVVLPSVPTTADEIDVYVSVWCPTDGATVTRVNDTIRIILGRDTGCPGNPPVQREQRIRLGSLTAGEYYVEVYHPEDPARRYAAGVFTVVEPADQAIRVHPFAIPTDAQDAKVAISTTEELDAQCPGRPCRVLIGGVEATESTVVNGVRLYTVPQLGPGLVDVTFTNGANVLVTAKNALYYFDRHQAPDLAVFERVLFPVLFGAAGANGSDWRTEAAIANPRRWPIETFNNIRPIVCILPPCGDRLAPLSKVRWSGGQFPRGVALIVARKDADDLAFALRARDVSRAAQGFGTEIPVVRENEMFNGTITLLNVPRDTRYRVKLRVYSWTAGEALVFTGTGLGIPIELTKTGCGDAAACAAIPAYAELDLAPLGGPSDMYVVPPEGAKAWAFATVTNNETQQVTLVTPDGEGGLPCHPCRVP